MKGRNPRLIEVAISKKDEKYQQKKKTWQGHTKPRPTVEGWSGAASLTAKESHYEE